MPPAAAADSRTARLRLASRLLGLVVPKNTTMPVTRMIRVETDRLTGYGPDASPLVIELPAGSVEVRGDALAIPWAPLQTVLGLLDAGVQVEASGADGALTIRQGRDSWTVQGAEDVTWPAEPPRPSDDDLELLESTDGLQVLATLTRYADQHPTALRCVWQEGEHAIATDGKRALAVPLGVRGLPPLAPQAATWIAGITRGATSAQVGGRSGPALCVRATHSGDVVATLRVRAGAVSGSQPPDVIRALRGPEPGPDTWALTCEASDLIGALRRALALCGPDQQAVVVRATAGGATVEPLHRAHGTATASVVADIGGSGEGRAAVHGEWLAQLLQDWGTPTVTLRVGGQRWSLEDEQGRLGLVMAVTLPDPI